MGDSTEIQWTDATKRCSFCGDEKPLGSFARDRSRPDGHTYVCLDCRNLQARARYVPRPKPAPGRRYVPARDGDARQARRRVNHLVDVGLLPKPSTLACFDCGEDAAEYHHHEGYSAAHHEDVIPLCVKCHRNREEDRRG